MMGLSAGTAEAGEPVPEERLAAGPRRGQRLEVGWGQGVGDMRLALAVPIHGPPSWETPNANQDSGFLGMQPWVGCPQGCGTRLGGDRRGWGCWPSCWAPRKLAGRQKSALPCPNPPHPQECSCCLEGHHRGDGARRAGPCHCLRGLPHPRRGGHPDRPHLQGADAQEGTQGEDVSPMPRRWGQLSPRLLTLPAGHRAAAEGAGGAAGDGEGAGQGEEAVHPPPAEQ